VTDAFPDTPSVRAAIEDYLAAWNRHALDAILAHHTEDSVFQSHTTAELAKGHASIRRMIARYFRLFPDLTFTIRRLYVYPGLVAQEWTAHAVHTVPIPTVRGLARPTGAALTWEGVDVMPMQGLLIARKDAYVDSAALQRQIEVELDATSPKRSR
jgi:steroid delta-isomerase-like uncharacterized protein